MPSVVVLARPSARPFAAELTDLFLEIDEDARLMTVDGSITSIRAEALHFRGRTESLVVVADGGLAGREFERWSELAEMISDWLRPSVVYLLFAADLGSRKAQQMTTSLEAIASFRFIDRPERLPDQARSVVERFAPLMTIGHSTRRTRPSMVRSVRGAIDSSPDRMKRLVYFPAIATLAALGVLAVGLASRESTGSTTGSFAAALAASSALAAALMLFVLTIRYRESRREILNEIDAMRRGLEQEMVRQRTTLSESTNRLASFAAPIASPGTPVGVAGPEDGSSSSASRSTLAKEIGHAIQTPLSQIAAAAELLDGDIESPEYAAEIAERIRRSVLVSQAFLSAFRELEEAGPAGASNRTLREMMIAGAAVYNPDTAGVDVSVQVPAEVAGYSPEYLCAILFPIMENAVEAARPDSGVNIAYRRDSLSNVFTVSGSSRTAPGGDEIYEPGRTTKTGHDGMGLCMVKTLLSSFEGASIVHRNQDNKVTFTVVLPQRHG